MPVDMNKDGDGPADGQQATEAHSPACGERLAEGRRAQQITVLEIAKELHLDEPKVRALERNEFQMLGAPVFAKGHLRKYAELVGVDVDDVIADYYKMTRSSDMPPVVLERPKIKQELSPGPWIAGIIVILAAVVAYWLISARDAPSGAAEREPAPQELDAAADLAPQDVGEPVMLVDATSAADELAAAPLTTAQPEPVPQIVDDGQLHLALSFSGECWTEISDADGRRLFFDMGRSGRDIELIGKAPFSALFGNAENVSLRVNGNDYTIPVADRSGRMARLTILGQ